MSVRLSDAGLCGEPRLGPNAPSKREDYLASELMFRLVFDNGRSEDAHAVERALLAEFGEVERLRSC